MRFLVLFGLAYYLFFLGGTSTTLSASFDCRKARTTVEMTICGNVSLSRLDHSMGLEYQKQLRTRYAKRVRAEQQQWIRERDDFCDPIDGVSYSLCVEYMISKRLLELRHTGWSFPWLISYGSRVGMNVTALTAKGINTDRAYIEVDHTWQNARAFCVEYGFQFDYDCANEVLAESTLGNFIAANCHTGQFTSMLGEARFLGRKTGADHSSYLFQVDGEVIDDSMSSGYFTYLDNYRALCPSAIR